MCFMCARCMSNCLARIVTVCLSLMFPVLFWQTRVPCSVFSFASPVTSCSFVSAVFPLCFYLFRYPYMYVSLPLFIVGSSVNLPLSQVFVYFLLFLVFKYFVFPVYVFVIILVFGHNERHASCYNLFLFPCFVCLHLGPLLSIPHSLPSQIMTHCACSHLHFMVVSVFHW